MSDIETSNTSEEVMAEASIETPTIPEEEVSETTSPEELESIEAPAIPVAEPEVSTTSHEVTGYEPATTEWMKKIAASMEMEVSEILAMYKAEEKDLKAMGIDGMYPKKEFEELVMGSVNSQIAQEASYPSRNMQMFVYGPYPSRGKDKEVQEIVGMIYDLDNPQGVKYGIMSAWEDQAGRTEEIDSFMCLDTKFGFSEEVNARDASRYKITMKPQTKLVNKELSWVSNNIKDQLSLLNTNHPLINLADVTKKNPDGSSNLSRIIEEDGSRYVDVLSIKHIRGSVASFKKGISNGRKWAKYLISDASYIDNEGKPKQFLVWVDYDYAMKIGAGPNSLVDFYGTLYEKLDDYEKSKTFGQIVQEMSACIIFPISKKEMKVTGAIKRDDDTLLNAPAPMPSIPGVSMTGF